MSRPLSQAYPGSIQESPVSIFTQVGEFSLGLKNKENINGFSSITTMVHRGGGGTEDAVGHTHTGMRARAHAHQHSNKATLSAHYHIIRVRTRARTLVAVFMKKSFWKNPDHHAKDSVPLHATA